MQLERALLGRAVRLTGVSGPVTPGIHGVVMARAFEEKYGFLQGPRSIDDFDLKNGIKFFHGVFREGVIDTVQIFSDGVLVEAKSKTDYCDDFIDDFVDWAQKELHLKIQDTEGSRRAYYSNIEVIAEFSMGDVSPNLHPVGNMLSSALRGYGQSGIAEGQVFGISFSLGAGGNPVFHLQQRLGADSDSRKFFSQAPLRTSDHLDLLSTLERIAGRAG